METTPRPIDLRCVPPLPVPPSEKLRATVTVRGVVQGVGFRPFVYQLATHLKVSGFVRNESSCVRIEVQGSAAQLAEFFRRLLGECPPQARIDSAEVSYLPCKPDERTFQIVASQAPTDRAPVIPADLAVCRECLAEVSTPGERRFRYPFTNCTNCGPRWSLIRGVPYDRCNTSMAGFALCPECRREYENPADRRFHAQPIACPLCGPHIELRDREGRHVDTAEDALLRAAEAVLRGQVLALMGLGGFQLIVDATSASAVRELRQRKCRPHKPFALMFPSLESARAYCVFSSQEERWLHSPQAPILLVRRRMPPPAGLPPIAEEVAPNNPYLGCMLPYTPLHYLLMEAIGRPIVCTSGNLSEEPMAYTVEDGLRRLGNIADLFLVHNRPIIRPVDDSVARLFRGRLQLLRRARGFAPVPVKTPSSKRVVLATGAHQKNTVGLQLGSWAILSSHIGDLDNTLSLAVHKQAVEDLLRFFDVKPEVVACDAHPDYLSTQYARKLAAELGTAVIPVQHHHAHAAACMAEHNLDGPVLGVAWDGAGHGTDGTLWGGEFLLTTLSSFRRVASLRPFPLPGGEKAAREPCRSALGLLYQAQGLGGLDACRHMFTPAEVAVLARMLERRVNTPLTSSVGRLFDAVAALVGLSRRVTFEGQAAMELEFAALTPSVGRYRFAIREGTPLLLDWEPVLSAILADVAANVPREVIAWAFHEALASAACEIACRVGVDVVVISGGCFQNRLLSELTVERLAAAGFRVYWPEAFPPNDGGIALGQLAVACARLENGSES